MNNDTPIIVIGAGAYGTALAIAIARNGHRVLLWGRNLSHNKTSKEINLNYNSLPKVSFPPTLHLETSLSLALTVSRNIMIVVPSSAFKYILAKIKPHLRHDSRIVWATKGLEAKTGRLLHEVAREILGDKIPLAVLSGPNFAQEIAIGLPTAVVLSTTDAALCADLQQLLNYKNNFRVYSNHDLIGVQLSGVAKNIIAIGAGISDSIGFGANARTALITRGLAEILRLGIAMGADSNTFMGMAGLGDLILTCTDNQSRNRRFGMLIGQGICAKAAQKIIKQVVEGYQNVREILILASRYKIEMPITEQIYQVLYQNKNIHQAALSLLERPLKEENEINLSS